MIFIESPQGTPDWHAARCGRITASCFADAVSTVGGLTEQQTTYVNAVRAGNSEKTAGAIAGYKGLPTSDTVRRALLGESTEEFSDTARRYAADLAIERISAQPHGEPAKAWVLERGHTMEEIARRQYEARTGSFVTEAGICITDDGSYGYSSDGLVDDDGLIEIKAPIDSIKILAMLSTGDTSEYDHQMQGGMWITGRKWCDFIMYVPGLAAAGRDLFVKRVYRDEAFIAAMAAQLVLFDGLVRETQEIFMGPAVIVEPDAIEAPADVASLADLQAFDLALCDAPLVDLLADMRGPVDLRALDTHIDATRAAEEAPPTLRLGQITERLGFTITADFALSLGFAPVATDKAAKLYHERDFPMICAALVRHIGAVQAKLAA